RAVQHLSSSETTTIEEILVAVTPQSEALSILEEKHQRGLFLHMNLAMIACRCQFPIPCQDARGQLRRSLNRGADRGRSQFSKCRQHGVHLQDVVVPEQAP